MNDENRVVVIGSGPSGAIASLVLLQQGIPVTMLESGDAFPGGLLIRAMGRNVYRRRPPLEESHVSSDTAKAVWYRALVPGGLSNYWTGAVPRFAPEDFFEGARLHEQYRWPVTYDELLPYYEQVERFMGISGGTGDVPSLPASKVARRRQLPVSWQEVATHAAAFGQGLVPLPMADVKPTMITRSGAAFNSFTQIVPLLRRFQHFELRMGAHVLRLSWCGTRQRIRSVHYFDRVQRTEQRIEAAAVVVAAGALASTELLMNSACSDFPGGLGNDEDVLGRYLHDHPKDWCVVTLEKSLPRLGHAAYLTRAPYDTSPPLLGASATIGNSGSSAWDKLLTFTPLPARAFGVTTFGTMIPTRDTRIEQDSQEKDEFGLPTLHLKIHYGPEVVPTMLAARERLATILDTAGYHASFPADIPSLKPGLSVHYGGTIRMHSSPQYGMLDTWNRIHSVRNVVVADASCFTTAVEKNPAATAMALSARAANRLAQDLKACGPELRASAVPDSQSAPSDRP